MQLDEIDQALLAALRENARESTADLARRVGRSRTTVQGRLERLERRGVIQGYALRLAEDFEAGAVRAHVLIKVAPRESRAVEAGIAGNLERQVSFDDSHFGSFHRLGPSSPLLSGSRHGAGRGECRGQ